jgi:hypothetical protein
MSNSDTTSPNRSGIARRLSRSVLFVLLALLLFLGIQSQWSPVQEASLAGATEMPELPDDAFRAWLSGEWQTTVNQRTNREFAWRSKLIRLINQARYSLWDEHTPQVITGTDGYLFEAAYRQSVCGEDFVGNDSIAHMIRSLDRFRNSLLERGKRLVIMIAPNKWRTLANKVNWNCEPKRSNYQTIVPELQARGYAVFDAIEVFEYEQSQDPAHPIHSKQGTHWSLFGAAISIDYLRYAFAQEGMTLPTVAFSEIEQSDHPRNTDRDLHDLMNIWVAAEKETLAYPRLSFSGDHRPRVCVIGDSYYWTYFTLGAHDGLFAMESKFFYYNKSIAGADPFDASQRLALNDDIRRAEIEASDAVLLVISEPSLRELGFGIQRLELL